MNTSYVDNWLFMNACSERTRNSLALTESFAPHVGYVISSRKTWISSTVNKIRNGFRGLQVARAGMSIPLHKVEVGLLLRIPPVFNQ